MEALKFREMPYERPDGEALKTSMRTLTEKLRAAGSYEAAKAVFLEKETLSKHIQTLATLAQVRHTIDTRDKFYDEENGFWNQLSPELEEYSQEWTKAMLASPYRADFEKEYGTLMFLNAEIALKTFSPEIIPELQKENDLTTEYDKLIASAQIPFEGGVYTLSQLSPFKTGADDAQRLAAWKAEGGWYKEHQSELDRLLAENAESALAQKIRLQAYFGKKDYAKVIDLADAAAAAQTDEEDRSDIYFTLGAAYNAREMKPQAIAALRKVVAGPNVNAAKASIAELSK